MPLSDLEEPGVCDIKIRIGNSFNRVLELEEDDGSTPDLSAYEADACVFDTETDAVLAKFVIPELKDDGLIPLTMRLSDTLNLEEGSANWAVTLRHKTRPDLETVTVVVGEVEIEKVAYVVPGGP